MENVDSAALITELCLVRDYVVVDGTFDHTRGFWVYKDRLWGGAPIGFVPPKEMARLSERGYVTVNAVGRAMLTADGLKRISAAGNQPEAVDPSTELWLRFLHSFALSDHLGDATNALRSYAEKAGLPIPGEHAELNADSDDPEESWMAWVALKGVDRGIHGK